MGMHIFRLSTHLFSNRLFSCAFLAAALIAPAGSIQGQSGSFFGSFGTIGAGNGQFNNPGGVAFSAWNTIQNRAIDRVGITSAIRRFIVARS